MNIVVSPRAIADLNRLREFLAAENPQASQRAIQTLIAAIESLRDFSGRGRPLPQPRLRELIVPFGKSAYVVRYSEPARGETIVILRVWHSRETYD